MPASPVRRVQSSQLTPRWSLEGALGKGVPEYAGAYYVSDGALVEEAVTPIRAGEGGREPLLGHPEAECAQNGPVDLTKELKG